MNDLQKIIEYQKKGQSYGTCTICGEDVISDNMGNLIVNCSCTAGKDRAVSSLIISQMHKSYKQTLIVKILIISLICFSAACLLSIFFL